MTDVSELIQKCREAACDCEWPCKVGEEAADALEAQAKLIADYEACTDAGREHRLRVEAESRLAAAEEQMKVDRLIVEEARRNEVAAERDAERYRWLRHRLPVTAIHCRDEAVEIQPCDIGEPTDEAYASEVDAAIDAAREGK